MRTEQMPTISMIMPLKQRILASKHSGSDSKVVKGIKAATAHDFEDRYPNTDRALIQLLHVSTGTTHDAIFKTLTESILDDCPQTAQVFHCFNINRVHFNKVLCKSVSCI